MANKDLNVVAFGEIMMTRRISVYEEPEFLSLIKTLRDADVGLTNIEGLGMSNFKGYRLVGTGGTPMSGEPYIADEFKWAGFNLVSIANNHTMDYGGEGLAAGIEALDKANLVHAGAGKDLTLAREPGYLETRKGRVALISSTSASMQLQPSTGLHTMATEAGKGWPGRPGINPLRWEVTYSLTPDTIKELEKVHFLGRVKMASADKPGAQYKLFKSDYEGNLAQIKEAKRQADWVVASNHSHEEDHSLASEWGNTTAEYIRQYYKDCIDAGADVFYGHGDHEGQGIEIYKGKPIFYSLANPICTSQSMRRFPLEEYERYGLSYDSTPTDWMIARHQISAAGGRRGYCNDRWLQTVVATFKIDGWHGKLSELKLIPVDSGADERVPNGGGAFAHRGVRPLIAKGMVAKKIIERYAKMSEPFGTEIEFKDGVGVVKL